MLPATQHSRHDLNRLKFKLSNPWSVPPLPSPSPKNREIPFFLIFLSLCIDRKEKNRAHHSSQEPALPNNTTYRNLHGKKPSIRGRAGSFTFLVHRILTPI